MNSQQAALSGVSNATIGRSLGFYIRGFSSLQQSDHYFIFLLVLYIGTLLANILIMSIIWFTESLHTPKYIAVFSLAVVDVSYSTALIPKAFETFIFNSRFVFYDACLTQMFFVHYFSAMESLALSVLAYDRFIAICFPLRCNTINTNRRMFLIVIISWTIPFVVVVVSVSLIFRLSFCRSVIINSYFCDYGPLFKSACNDYSANWFMAALYIVALFFVPLAFILISYACIVVSIMKITSKIGRMKAFKTCTAHLTLVAIFYTPLLVTYIIAWVNVTIDTDTRIFNSSLSSCIPPLINPIIYTLKTEDITNQIKKYIRSKKVSIFR
ncbi:putative gustatory receptor clone PTE01 [Erpetoichthys calabaricus]|uniref:putative gustatory receptor clone PTE01 n=1 Tax=Erpetoichthys calabaricus TaxID=27687 RepID=UPI00109FAB95|nr:putative gustatory receptor clone PTE01 [Erpetoichthys calabaricus]